MGVDSGFESPRHASVCTTAEGTSSNWIAAHSDGCSFRCCRTNGMARSRSSGGYRVAFFRAPWWESPPYLGQFIVSPGRTVAIDVGIARQLDLAFLSHEY